MTLIFQSICLGIQAVLGLSVIFEFYKNMQPPSFLLTILYAKSALAAV
jgi:hypothetical protein